MTEGGVRGKSVRNSLADMKVGEEEGEEVLQVLKQRFSCSPWRRPQRSKHCPAVRGEDHARAGGYSLKDCIPWKDSVLQQCVEEEGWAEELLQSGCSPPLAGVQGKSILELHKTYDGIFR